MATTTQREAAKKNIDQAQESWQARNIRSASSSTKKAGDYFRIVVRPKEEFRMFSYQDVGRTRHVQRLAGRRASGTWDTHSWLISKRDAHIEGKKLVPDTSDAKEVLDTFHTEPKQVKEDLFVI